MDENDYESLRKRNIAERNAVFAEFFKDIKKNREELKEIDKRHSFSVQDTENQPPRKRRRISAGNGDEAFRVASVRLNVRRKYNTRSRTRQSLSENLNESDEEDDKPKNNKHKIKVLFPWAKPFQRSIDLMNVVLDVDEEEQSNSDSDSSDFVEKKKVMRVTKSVYDPDSIPSVDEITQKMLDNVAERSSSKEYCKIRGTSCHQCRQKTLDTKTVCRSGECVGVRGQFCGPCLKGRYGESALEALKDPNWACPPCRGLCNCSICRTRNGLPPTGILAPVAHEEGYSSVMDYLQSAETDDT